ncbi:MAG: hypothetical protein GXP31_12620 [Kiritimatiellaeota bacterium]|nr:hypothetical protein [Kiritimatiellota bacterium]
MTIRARIALSRVDALHGACRTTAMALVLAWISAASYAAAPAPVVRTPEATAVGRVVAKVVAQLMSRYHYSRHPLDDEISKQLFNDYFSRLDPNHSYFLASDIQEFQSYRLILDDLLLQGNVDFAYEVYRRLVERVRDRLEYCEKRLPEPFDFNKDESILLDRSKAPWPASKEELDALWRKRLKNNLLTYELMDEEKKAKQKKNREKTTSVAPETKKKEAPEAPPAKGNGPAEKAPPGADAGRTGPQQKETVTTPPDKPREASSSQDLTPRERVLRNYRRYLRRLEENDSMDVLEIYLSTMTRVYDPHSAYMAPDTEEDFDISMKLSLQGIGALLTTEDEYVKVAGIIPGGPADRDGRLKEGDRIVAVAQEKDKEPVDVVNMPLRRVVRLIRGPKGTKVLLTVIEAAKGLGSAPVVIDITRGEVKLTDQAARSELRELPQPPAPAAPLGKALVVSLPSFYSDFEARRRHDPNYKSSTRDVRRLIEKAEKETPLAGMILDLRSNGGGSLDEAIGITGLFIPKGPVVQVRQGSGKVRVRADDDGKTYYDGPLVVLVNRLSASASEIVAAAIQDYHRGILVGEASTHGKGTVQTVYHLDRTLRYSPIFKKQKPGSLKFTMAKFYRVSGGSTQKKGVTPDIVLPSFTDYMELGEAHLPHVMPWDEITPLDVVRTVDVERFRGPLRVRSERRRSRDPEFQALVTDIHQFGERRSKKTLTLNRAKRVKYQKEEEEWARRIRSVKITRSRSRGRKKKAEDEDGKDLVMEEALHVLADLVRMQAAAGEGVTEAESGAAMRRETAAAAKVDVPQTGAGP